MRGQSDYTLMDEQRAAERMWALRPGSVSDSELLGLLLGSGTAGRPSTTIATELLKHLGGLSALALACAPELAEVSGVGLMRAARINAAFELARRAQSSRRESVQVLCAKDAFELLAPRLGTLQQESFMVIALGTRGHVIADFEIARGSLYGVEVHPREVFRPLIRCAAGAGVIAHNHPSGDVAPSPEDIALTARLRKVGELIGIPIVDHVIIGNGRFFSMAEEHLGDIVVDRASEDEIDNSEP
jgi:DNA repair protein RadC